MKRRALLTGFGVGMASLTGCAGPVPDGSAADRTRSDSTDRTPSASPTDTDHRLPMGDAATIDGATLRVANPRVRASVMQDNLVWQDLKVPDGWFVVVDVTTEGAVPTSREQLTLTGSVRRRGDPEPLVTGGPVVVADEGSGEPNDPSTWEGQPVAVPFAAERYERASVRWKRGSTTFRWPIGESIRTTLVGQPAFRLESIDARRIDGRRRAGSPVEVSMTVANRGNRDARFLAKVSAQSFNDMSTAVGVEVPAGDTRTYEGVPAVLEHGVPRTVVATCRVRGARRRFEIQLPEPAATESPTPTTPTATPGTTTRSRTRN